MRNTVCAPQVSVGIMMAPVTYLKHITSAAVLLADLDVDTVSTLLCIPGSFDLAWCHTDLRYDTLRDMLRSCGASILTAGTCCPCRCFGSWAFASFCLHRSL